VSAEVFARFMFWFLVGLAVGYILRKLYNYLRGRW